MRVIWVLAAVVLLLQSGCASPARGVGLGPGADTASWPAPDKALEAASEAMGALQSLRESESRQIFRDEQPFLSLTAERAYQAPDRRWFREEGRAENDSVVGEGVQVADRFYKRIGDTATWQKVDQQAAYAWPAQEFRFPGAYGVTWVGSGESEGRPARILAFQHAGSVETRNAGWEFQTRLWLDPETGYILQRHTTGTHRAEGGAGPNQRFDGSWVYRDHNASLAINEPQRPGATS